MPFIDTNELPVSERRPGWKGRGFDSANMSFVHFTFEEGSSIHEHWHSNEEVWNLIEGRLEVTIGATVQFVGPGAVAVVPSDTPHSVRALSNGKAIVVDHPLRHFDTDVERAIIALDFELPFPLPDHPSGGPLAIPFALRNWAAMPALVKTFEVEALIIPSAEPAVSAKLPIGELPTLLTVQPNSLQPVSVALPSFTAADRQK